MQKAIFLAKLIVKKVLCIVNGLMSVCIIKIAPQFTIITLSWSLPAVVATCLFLNLSYNSLFICPLCILLSLLLPKEDFCFTSFYNLIVL